VTTTHEQGRVRFLSVHQFFKDRKQEPMNRDSLAPTFIRFRPSGGVCMLSPLHAYTGTRLI
jgi:hypothetical protein